MLVNYEVPTSSYASESEDISREIGALRRACISLASIPPKQAQRDPAPFIGVIIYYYYFFTASDGVIR